MGFAFDPFPYELDAALIKMRHRRFDLQPLWPRLILHQLSHSALQPSRIVFERRVEHVALGTLLVAQCEAAPGHPDCGMKEEPRLASLWLTGEERQAFDDVVGHYPLDWRKLHVLKRRCRERCWRRQLNRSGQRVA